MDIKTLTRGLAYIVLASALLVAAIALNNRQYQATEAPKPSLPPSALDSELAHCNAMDVEAADDVVCKAAWEANRKRFFEYHKSSPQGEVSKATPQSPARSSPFPSSGHGRREREQ
jgi:conjugative transfer region protein TrbK